jgi:hypothetical protein
MVLYILIFETNFYYLYNQEEKMSDKFIDSPYLLYGLLYFVAVCGIILVGFNLFTLNENKNLRRNLKYCEMFVDSSYSMGATDYYLYIHGQEVENFDPVMIFLEGSKKIKKGGSNAK